jgi:dihydrofolate synthase/folylpolyglutamate synthase
MTYQELLTYIYGLGRFGMKPGLARIKTLLETLSNPQDCLNVIHVAGTNGKGSTAAFLSAILSAGGHKVGFF